MFDNQDVDEILRLLNSTQYDELYGRILYAFIRFLLGSFVLFLAAQALSSLPLVQKYTMKPAGQLAFSIALIVGGGLFSFFLVPLRMIHEFGLVTDAKVFLWPDIILSGLALSRLTIVWSWIMKWVEKKMN